ncbi:LITAF domain-containing protein-like [Eurosta solidaginis]|uniref:LITAF domain-containing protein-like n=1 Tax=Eurosta solidaginis TaxID=178769 RepID=UPI003530CA8D
MVEKSTIPPRIYPSAPLEQVVITSDEQQQALLPTAPPTYDQAIGAAPTTTNTPQVVLIARSPMIFGSIPLDLLCPYCHNYTRTRLRSQPSSRTHLVALFLCLFQMYCCVCLPYCIDNCMDTVHYCGLCDQYLGTYVRE